MKGFKKVFSKFRWWLFLVVGLWAPQLLTFDLKIGFPVKNCRLGPLNRLIGGLGPFKRVLKGFKGVRGVIVLDFLQLFLTFLRYFP